MLNNGDEFLLAIRFLTTAWEYRLGEKALKLIDFNPEKEFREVMDHIARKMAELGQ